MKYRIKRLRIDAGYLISALLLVAALIAIASGVIADVWDLNDFVYHRQAGYMMAGLALLHVLLYWHRLSGYVRRRIRRSLSRYRSDNRFGAIRPTEPARPAEIVVLTPRKEPLRYRWSRRGFVGLAAGGVGGWSLSRRLGPPDLPYGSDVGEIYHQWSKPSLLSLLGSVADWGQRPAKFKEYPEAERTMLPEPNDFRGLHTEDAIRQRRSVRSYSDQPLTLDEFSRLMLSTAGITDERGHRAAPSAGALYPIEVYAVINAVDGAAPGLYHYAVREHALDRLRSGDLRGEIVRNALLQGFLGEASVVLVFTAVFQRLRWKYRERTYRYALLETGHLGQNAYLAATSMGLHACAVGAFLDNQLNAMLNIDGQTEAALYLLSVGKP